MNVLRGVSLWLAVFCLAGLTVSVSGCGKKTKTAVKTEDKTPEKTTPNATGKTDVVQNSGKKTEDGDTPTKITSKTKPVVKDPPTVNKGESGSGTKRKLRGPKLGSGT